MVRYFDAVLARVGQSVRTIMIEWGRGGLGLFLSVEIPASLVRRPSSRDVPFTYLFPAFASVTAVHPF